MNPATRRLGAALTLGLGLTLTGCTGTINRTIKKRILPEALSWQDLELSCTFGQAAVGLLQPVGKEPADVAMILGWLPAGVCAEMAAWDARRDEALVLRTHGGPADRKIAASNDAAYRAERAFALAATRYDRAYQHWALRYGDVEDCSKLRDEDQQVYLLGLLSGALSLVADASAKGAAGIPQNRLLDVARATECLDDERFFHIPTAVRGAAWATIPGTAPEGVDPWAVLTEAAEKGDALGQSIPRSLLVFTSSNAGKEDAFTSAIEGFSELQPFTPKGATPDGSGATPRTEWALMDAYGWALSLYEADLVWIREEGHRAPSLGELPTTAEAGDDDPFGAGDPFGGDDPFGSDGSGEDDASPTDPADPQTPPEDDAAAPGPDAGETP